MFMRTRKRKKLKIDTFCKAITAIVMGHGMLLVTASYILSWYNHEPVSDVSVAIVSQIIAPPCVYMITNLIANIFEKNKLSFSEPLNHIDEGGGFL